MTPARIATLCAIPVAALVAGLLLWRTVSGSAAVPMVQRSLGSEQAAICSAVVAGLPEVVREARRRPVTEGAQQNAAYGNPPITLACGTEPLLIRPTDRVDGLNGVCWYAVAGSTGTNWTTVDRVVAVTVTVPGMSEGSAQSVIPFSAAVAAADPRLPSPPSGCP